MTKIKYIKGDATNPQGEGNKLIAHICNDKHKWGAGFVLALSKKWKVPEQLYYKTPIDELKLGTVRYVFVEEGIAVANMIAQHDTKPINGIPPIRYDALERALVDVNDFCKDMGYTLHMPKIGSGLAGGDWTIIEKIIEDNVQVPVTVYEFEKKNN
jgi:O-acetyl-ADP-ribose deacetylase (regulator of RNase III)